MAPKDLEISVTLKPEEIAAAILSQNARIVELLEGHQAILDRLTSAIPVQAKAEAAANPALVAASVAASDRQTQAMNRLATAFETHARSMDAHGVVLNDMMARNEKRIAEMKERMAARGIDIGPGGAPFVRVPVPEGPKHEG